MFIVQLLSHIRQKKMCIRNHPNSLAIINHHEVGAWVGVLEGVSALCEHFACFFQVFPVDPASSPAFHFFLCDCVQLLLKLLLQPERPAVVVPALEVVQILGEGGALGIHAAQVSGLLELGTFVIFGAVFFPRAAADPTKIEAALGAGHVIATAALFDARAALGTVLRIRRNVIRCLRIVATLL